MHVVGATQEGVEVDFEVCGEDDEGWQVRYDAAAFEAGDGGHTELCEVCELFLGEAAFDAVSVQDFAEGPSWKFVGCFVDFSGIENAVCSFSAHFIPPFRFSVAVCGRQLLVLKGRSGAHTPGKKKLDENKDIDNDAKRNRHVIY